MTSLTSYYDLTDLVSYSLLISQGADPCALTVDDDTPADIAMHSEEDRQEAFKTLCAAMDDIGLTMTSLTPLLWRH